MSVKVRRIGKINYNDLDNETQDDVVFSIQRITKEEIDDVRIGLENGPAELSIVTVAPSEIWESLPKSERVFSPAVVSRYKDERLKGSVFPPIVIDSSDKIPLHEGFHRTISAIKAGFEKIQAIDLAGVYVKKTKEGLETYGFLR